MAANRTSCADWDDLLSHFEDYRGWIFRGQCSAHWSLETTLERLAASVSRPAASIELVGLREFRRRAHNYVPMEQIPSSDGEWLALMQHYGAPTRLLDFTYSPYVAAYFAFEEAAAGGCPGCAVWAINPTWVTVRLGIAGLTGGALGVSAEAVRDAITASKVPPPPGIDPFPTPDDLMAGSILAAMIPRRALSNAPPDLVGLFEPAKLSPRMAAQQGVFVWPATVKSTFMANLEGLGELPDGVRVLVIPSSVRDRALEQLRLMNITRASLFPGLEGFAHSFRQLPIRESEDSWRSRAIVRTLLRSIPTPNFQGPSDKPIRGLFEEDDDGDK